ncbi:hypothetical protein FXO38_20634 [Capsicum annuum]|uniref:probable WRKY transcription factor 11 n=1 Tax=Capsicum annuum TaxID=4072 RepID=UPI0007BF7EE4|nr:probable WRKY transcription factor 11 [Capsicum annuum]KAF3643365.1 hypothetical protein FXO38_20634 [Capsicum annuum]KAF3646008.1 hypothetical protein FXO37_20682 [Capsicum annuum]
MNKELALQEAASTGLKIMEHLIKLTTNESVVQVDYHEITDFAVAKLKKANAMVGRTGHARFRRGPVQVQAQNKAESQAQVQNSLTSLSLSPYGYMEKERVLASMTLSVVASVAAPVQTELTLGFKMPIVNDDVGGAGVGNMKWKDDFGGMKNWINSSSFLSFITGEGSESIVNVVPPPSSSMLLLPIAQVVSAEKQSSATGKRCREQEQSGDGSGKKRKVFPRKVIRTSVISSKITDIPADECSWRKYDQKLIKGSPHPRVYYKCTSFPGCPAKKHVERVMEDPMMLIVTYEEEHHHTQVAIQEYNSQMMAFGLAGEK